MFDPSQNNGNKDMPNSFLKIRGLGLLGLYAALGILCLLLALASFRLWPSADTTLGTLKVISLALTSSFTAISAMRACARMWIVLRNFKAGSAYIDFMPFIGIGVTILAAGWLFEEF